MHIDVHAHFLAGNCFDVTDSAGRHYGPSIIMNEKGQEEVVQGNISSGPIARQMWDPETRINDIDATGVDIQIISPIPLVLYYNLESEACLWFSRQINDEIARVVREYPTRFVGLATVPLQDTAKALAELDRAINKLGLRGIEILSNINGRDLDAPELMPFYKEVEALDVPIFIHPGGMVGSGRTKDYYLTNLVAYPFDTALAAAHLIFGGVLEKCPNLKFCLAHGGGNLPYIRGRLEHGYQVRTESKAVIKQPPSHYFPLLYFDTITHFPPALEYLITSAGADKVLMGTDYPYDMADSQPVLTVQNLKNISEEDKQLVLGGNARRIFKL